MTSGSSIQVIDGCALHREGSGAPIVCLPAFADSCRSWRRLVSALSDRWEVVVVEFPGLGRPGRLPVGPTVTAIANLIVGIVRQVWATPVTLVGHSLGSAVAVRAARQLDGQCRAVVSIEGNLTADDAFLTGRAAGYADPDEFKTNLAAQIDQMVTAGRAPASFAESVRAADAATMWALGRDVVLQSRGDGFGHEFLRLTCPRLYLWSRATTSQASQDFLHAQAVPHHELGIAHHWPWIVDPTAIAGHISRP